jgi:hypothetical protein
VLAINSELPIQDFSLLIGVMDAEQEHAKGDASNRKSKIENPKCR